MEWKVGEHWFAYFVLLLLFVVAGAFWLLLLDIFKIGKTATFLVFIFSMLIIFAPIAKYWHSKF